MKKSLVLAVTCLTLLIFPVTWLLAQRRSSTYAKGQVEFISEAPHETIHARSKNLKGVVDWDKGTFLFTIEIKSFSGFNTPVQREHFNENYMESDLYPTASFQGKIIEVVNLDKHQSVTVRAKGKMKIHGIERELIVPLNLKIKSGEVMVNARFSVALDDYNIKIPRIVSEKLSPNIDIIVATSLSEMK